CARVRGVILHYYDYW
nr:immunoglobulin heavy chain junction region [Macaca mulatta]